ncbi:DUF2946 family protein [Noviherbaspirillum agri]
MWVRSGDGLKRTAWVALLALLVQGLLPSFIHASTSQGTIRSEICTAFGIKTVEQQLPDSSDGKHERKHCTVCTVFDFGILATHSIAGEHVVPVIFRLRSRTQDPILALAPASLHLRGPPRLA